MKITTTKFNPVLLLLIMSLFFGLSLNAQSLHLNENFDMEPNSNLSGQNGWVTGASSTYRINITSGGLSYADYPSSSIGNAAFFTPVTDRLEKVFSGSLSSTTYYSFLIQVSTAGSGDFFIGLFSNNAFRSRTYIKGEGAGFQIGLTKTTTGTVSYTSGTPLNFGEIYLVVVKYEFIAGSNTNDRVSLYLNPNPKSSEPTIPTIGPLSDTGNDLSANVLAMQGRANTGDFVLDGIRVASRWETLMESDVPNHFIELPKFISSNMVLQREIPLTLRGWGSKGDSIQVTLNRQGVLLSDTSQIDQSGKWELTLPAQEVCKDACTLTFSLINNPEISHELENILIGDVWFAGGQSNMEKKVNHLLEAEQYISEADNYPEIRSFRAAYLPNNVPQEKVNNASSPWIICNSTNVGEMVSAVAYVFSRELNSQLDVPIGILQSYRGGTEIETWISRDKIMSDPELCKTAGRIQYADPTNANLYPSINFNGQINPLVGFPIKGFIFYQGESNTKRALEYRIMTKKLIEDWRSLWGMGDLPFYYVQLFNMGISSNRNFEVGNWQDIREQQELLQTVDILSNTGMVVSIDTNEDPNNSDDNIRIHPRNKKPIGERLAKIALVDTYNFDIIAKSPILSRFEISEDSIYLYFNNIGSGLKMKNGDTALKGFALAGSDRAFKSAKAKILNDSTIVLTNSSVSTPIAARYAWAKNPDCNLYNSADLPASPFRTDVWKSTFSYSIFKSSCSLSNDADLLTIRLNGVILNTFDPSTIQYTIQTDKLPFVTAQSNSSFADVDIIQATEQNGRKATITVVAENNKRKIYEIIFNSTTSVNQKKTDNYIVKVLDKKITIKNNSNMEAKLYIFDSTGRSISHTILNPLSDSEILLHFRGAYYGFIKNKDGDKVLKFMIL